MCALVRELLGDEAPEDVVRFCQMSIVSQCFHPMIRRRFVEKHEKGKGMAPFLAVGLTWMIRAP